MPFTAILAVTRIVQEIVPHSYDKVAVFEVGKFYGVIQTCPDRPLLWW